MSEVLPAGQPPPLITPLVAVLSFCGAIGAALLAYFGARFTATAPLQASLNAAFRQLMEEWQAERARLVARNLELEGEIIRLRGTVNQGLAREQALQRRIDRLLS